MSQPFSAQYPAMFESTRSAPPPRNEEMTKVIFGIVSLLGQRIIRPREIESRGRASISPAIVRGLKESNCSSSVELEKAGFAQEGAARAYLKINGAWRDHLLFGVASGL